jgi:hypothetical protein
MASNKTVEENLNKIGKIKLYTEEDIEKLLIEYRDEQMPGWNEPYHYEAEGWQSMLYFLEWLKRKTNG